MTNETILQNFPDINQAFQGAQSLEEVCTNYIDLLNDSKDIFNILYANKLLEFLEAEKKISDLEDEFHEFKHYLRDWSQKNHVKVLVKMRKKDFIGFNEKIRLFLLTDRDLDSIRDLLGFRLILCTGQVDTPESIDLCYQLLNETIPFFAIQRKCLFLDAEPRVGKTLDSNSDVAKRILIPKKSNLLPGFEKKVKDYVYNPKANGYQSLHVCSKTPTGLVFEKQIRTFAMDLHAEYDEYCIHSLHKKERYSTEAKINLNLDLINLDGIAFDKNHNLLCDYIGLLKGSDLFDCI